MFTASSSQEVFLCLESEAAGTFSRIRNIPMGRPAGIERQMVTRSGTSGSPKGPCNSRSPAGRVDRKRDDRMGQNRHKISLLPSKRCTSLNLSKTRS